MKDHILEVDITKEILSPKKPERYRSGLFGLNL